MKSQSPQFHAGFMRFVACVPRRRMVKPLSVRAYCAMSDSSVLIPPAVFLPGKPQAGFRRVRSVSLPVRRINLKRSEIYRGKISRQKNQTNLEERTLLSAK
jgi:hypothetical protein